MARCTNSRSDSVGMLHEGYESVSLVFGRVMCRSFRRAADKCNMYNIMLLCISPLEAEKINPRYALFRQLPRTLLVSCVPQNLIPRDPSRQEQETFFG